MVALHNRRLTPRDLFPGVLWSDQDELAKRREIEREVQKLDLGHPKTYFEIERRLTEYRASQPSMGERQRICEAIGLGTARKAAPPQFTEEHYRYLVDRLEGVNDRIGLEVHRLAHKWLSSLSA